MSRAKRIAVAAVAAALPLTVLAPPPAQARAQARAAAPAKVVPVQVTGDPAKRFNLVIMGDGYTGAGMAEFRADLSRHLNDLWTLEPFKSYRSYINVYAIEIASGESGVSCDPDLSSQQRTTPLSMAFWSGCKQDGIQRLLVMDSDAAKTYADLVKGTTAGNRQIVALANSDTYGGAGGTYATASGGNAMSALITPHELGHSLGGLDDEYDYYQRGVPGGAYTGPEPGSMHHTLLTEQEMKAQKKKWWRWLGERSESGGIIGRYEGGLYSGTGVWRPSAHSMMKTLGYYYDQVSRERMTQRISGKLDLVQGNTPNDAPVGADRVLWVETTHPNGHPLSVTWTVDGKRAGTAHSLDLRRLHLRPGTHDIRVTVTDPTDFVRAPEIRSSDALTQTRAWTVDTRVKTPPADVPVDFTSSTPVDQVVSAEDVVYAETTHPVREAPKVHWTIDGRKVRGGDRDLDLARFHLRTGTHRVTARVGSHTRTWTVDAQRPTVTYEMSKATQSSSGGAAGRTPEYVFDGPFTMRLTGADDRGGVVPEFRVDGDGWFNYFGWPTDSQAPFRFSENGTIIDHLTYGKLAKGRHTIEYRGTDSAGNIGPAKKFVVTLR